MKKLTELKAIVNPSGIYFNQGNRYTLVLVKVGKKYVAHSAHLWQTVQPKYVEDALREAPTRNPNTGEIFRGKEVTFKFPLSTNKWEEVEEVIAKAASVHRVALNALHCLSE